MTSIESITFLKYDKFNRHTLEIDLKIRHSNGNKTYIGQSQRVSTHFTKNTEMYTALCFIKMFFGEETLVNSLDTIPQSKLQSLEKSGDFYSPK